jgi:hypothetical protein
MSTFELQTPNFEACVQARHPTGTQPDRMRGDVFAVTDGHEKLVATTLATMMTMRERAT